jgi:hypothetical protein
MEHNLYRPKPNTYKILKYLNQEIRETGNIECPLNEDTFSQHYKNLWTDANYDQKDWSSYTYDNDAITLDQARPTCSSRATCCPRHSVMLSAEKFEIRKRLLTLSLEKGAIGRRSNSTRFPANYERKLTTTSIFPSDPIINPYC